MKTRVTNKLSSRKRPAKATAQKEEGGDTSLQNESTDDFVEMPPPPLKQKETSGSDNLSPAPSPPPTATTIEPNLPDCPFCGKAFRESQSAQRISHLKTCASKNGLTSADQLVKIRRLEEKQAEERVALGLPAVPLRPQSNNGRSKAASSSSKAAVKQVKMSCKWKGRNF